MMLMTMNDIHQIER